MNSGKITTDARLISAMHTYGQYNGAATDARKLCKRARLQAAAQIGVQPTAVARRRVPLGGRRCLGAGRPTKAVFTRATFGLFVARHRDWRRRPTPKPLSLRLSSEVEHVPMLGKK